MEVKICSIQELMELLNALPDGIMVIVDFETGEVECVD